MSDNPYMPSNLSDISKTLVCGTRGGKTHATITAQATEIDELRNALAVAVDAIGDLSGLVNCETWCDARKGGHCKCGNEIDHAAIIDAANKNAILAKAITEAKS